MDNGDVKVITPEFVSEEVSPTPQQKRNMRKTFQAIRKRQIRKAEAAMRRARVLRQRLRNKE